MFEHILKKRKNVVSDEIKDEIQKHLDSRYDDTYANIDEGKCGTVNFASETPAFLKGNDSEAGKVQFQVWDDTEAEPLETITKTSLSAAETKALNLLLDEKRNKTFSETLLEMIDQQNCKDSVIYKRAHIDRRLFSKIASDKYYYPSKDTVLAFAFALGCDLAGANRLLKSAGFQLSDSSKRDMILEACFLKQIHDLTFVNEILAQFGQKIIGR